MAGPAYFDAFRRIVVQPDNITIAADAVDDTLTLVAGAGISLVASATSDQITIVNTNTSSPSTELFAKSLTVDGIVIDTNVIRGTDSNADLEIYANGTGAVKLLSDLVVSGNIKAIASVGGDGNDLTVQAGETVGGNGGDLTLKSGETTTGNGGIVYITAGDTITGNGGGIDLKAGDTISGDGGSIFITAGSSIGTGPGGSVTITSGDNLSNDAGDINLVAATSSSGADGVINLTTAIGSWTFNEAGNLTFPIGLIIEDFSGTPMIRSANGLAAVLGGAPALPGTSIIIQAGNAGADDGVDPMTGQSGGALIIAGGQGTGDFTGGSVAIFGGADANGDFADVVIGNGPAAFTFYGNGTLEFPDSTVQSTAWTGDVGDDITVGSIRINTNVIQTVDSNADLELRTSGTGSIRLNTNNVTVGSDAGATSQGSFAVAAGRQAGGNTQGGYAVAVGYQAGYISQGSNAVAIGRQAGYLGGQGASAVAVGYAAAFTNQGDKAVAIGFGAGGTDQGLSAVSIGDLAGNLTQGNYAIAIGYGAGNTNQPANSIVINASGSTLDAGASGLYISPIRNINGGTFLTYDTINKEIGYTTNLDDITVGSIRINTNVIQTIDSNADLDLRASGTGAVQMRSNLKLVDGTSPDGEWTSFTPTWTGSTTNPAIGNGLIEGRYKLVGKTVHVWMMMTAGSTTTFGSGEYKISLPVTARAIAHVVLNLVMNDEGTRLYNSLAHNGDTTSLSLDSDNVTLFWDTGVVTNTSPFTWASGDWFIVSGTYEAS